MPETTTLVAERQHLVMPAGVKELIEALIFAAEEPLTLDQIRAILQEGLQDGDARAYKEIEIETIISVLNDEYQHAQRPYRIVRIAGGYQFATTVEYAAWIGKLHKEQGRRKLSQSALETLAIIAYRQPITRPDIEAIRGVDCDYVLGTLLDKKLITIVGRAPTPGRPLLYGTTQQFLKHFGLNDISDLPRPREIEELLADARYETERRILEAQEQAEKAKKAEEDFKSRLPHIPKKKPDLDDSATIVPKKPGRPLTVKKTEETKESLPQPEVNPSATEAPKAEFAERREETTEKGNVDGQTTESSTPTIEKVQPKLEIPVQLPPSLQFPSPDVTDQGRNESEIRQSFKDSAVETTTSTTIEGTLQSLAPALSDEAGAVSEELKTVDNPDRLPEEPVPVVAEEEFASAEMESEVLEQDEVSISARDEQSTEVKTQAEFHPEQTTPPFDATSVRADVAPPVLAPIVDEVREPAQPKSRWTRFKEKIQGFIKKVFG
jgi:segregation and condensation protein B